MGQFGVGQPVRRKEDVRLLKGNGQYLDDLKIENELYAVIVRSPHAHAKINSIDISIAENTLGVVAVYTAKNLTEDNIGGIPCLAKVKSKDGKDMANPIRPLLANKFVRYVGDYVAIVLGESHKIAKDAAELVDVDYEVLPSTIDTANANNENSPLVWNEYPRNRVFDWENGDEKKTDDAFAQAKNICEIEMINNRIVCNSMEPRGAIASYDTETKSYTLHTPCQHVHLMRDLVSQALKIDKDKLRVISPDVGGGFGMKVFVYPEQALVTYAAKKLSRPIKWVSDRSEAFLSDNQGRDHVIKAAIATDENGKILGIKVNCISNMGAYLSNFAPMIATLAGTIMMTGLYDIPTGYVNVVGVFTNTIPIDAYRGAGRPEASHVIERLVDKAAQSLQIGKDEIRRINLIPKNKIPYKTVFGPEYDSGNFIQNLDDALDLADFTNFNERKIKSIEIGKLRGIGIACYVEAAAGAPNENVQIIFEDDGTVTVLVGTLTNGQGHATAYSQVLEELLGIDYEKINVVEGDTKLIATGGGTGGSKSMMLAAAAMKHASDSIIEKSKKIAAHLMEASSADINFENGIFTIVGTDRRMSISEIAKASKDQANIPKDLEPGLDTKASSEVDNGTYPNGCHICELEIDKETGEVDIIKYCVVDDFGKVINPLLVEGQVHGGIVQGVGQVLMEHCQYDPENGQLITGSFMDYAMPRADNFPFFDLGFNEVLCTKNPLGIKGAGEAGTVGALGCVVNALVNALEDYGISHVEMPATPERLWKAINLEQRV